ncbi:MAG: 4Fe-4S binding protein, partial [Candidatus Omnitrophica bacterium]|nr:4Fe-4S binding protein [Candidatus Omnitrophota bacterium]
MTTKKLVWIRQFSQTVFFSLFLYILWSTTHPLRGIFSPTILFEIDPLVVFLTSLSERIVLPGFIFSILMIVLTVILGRFFCGWVCPLGAFNDWVGSLKKKKIVPKDAANTKIRKIKYGILALVAIFALVGVQIAWVFDPLVIMARFVSLNLIPIVTLMTDKLFVLTIRGFGLYDGMIYDLYRGFKSSWLGIHVYYFSNSWIVFLFFLSIVLASLAVRRLWCRILCPLGAIYAWMAKTALVERKTTSCMDCGICQSKCRMGAILDDLSYAKGECILCMDCIYDCPNGQTAFDWTFRKKDKSPSLEDSPSRLSRRNFLILLFSSISVLGFRNRWGRRSDRGSPITAGVIRPPGALEEKAF